MVADSVVKIDWAPRLISFFNMTPMITRGYDGMFRTIYNGCQDKLEEERVLCVALWDKYTQ